MLALVICLLLIIITIFAYRVVSRPDFIRIINKLGNDKWLIDTKGVSGDPSFYVKFGRFEVLDNSYTGNDPSPHGTVHFTKYSMNGGFDYEAELEWSRLGESLRVGQMKLTLVPGAGGSVPTIMFTNDIESATAWSAPMSTSFD